MRALTVSALLAACLALLPAAAEAHAPSIGLSKRYISFLAAPGRPNPAAQVITLTNTTHGRMPWSASVSAITGGNWLTLSPSSGLLPGILEFESVNLSLTAASSDLSAGVYYAVITISAPGDTLSPAADNTPQAIEVALSVSAAGQAAPAIGLSASALALEGVAGREHGAGENIQIANLGGGSLTWTATPATAGGGDWLAVLPATGVDSGSVTIIARPARLARGLYNGRVTFTAPGAANSPREVSVSFLVRDPLPPSLRLNADSLSFVGVTDSPNPAAQRLEIANAGDGTLSWRASAATFNGGDWLAVSPGSGSGAGAIAVSAGASGLPPGIYAGRITVTADGALNSPAQIPVSLTVQRQRPAVTRQGIVNAASFGSFLAAGAIVSVFGSYLGPREGVSFTLDPRTGRIPTTVAGVSITFDGVPAPLFFVSFGQVNLQIPYEVANRGSARMVVNGEGLDPAAVDIGLYRAAPGIFTIDRSRAAALNQDSTPNSPENPAPAGSVIQLFLTGQGPVSPVVPTGALAPAEPPFPAATSSVDVRIDAYDATVLYAGLAPGFAGLMQLNVEIPSFVTPSDRVRVAVAIDRELAPLVTIAVK